MEDGIPRGLQHHHETCCEKGGHYGRRACMVQRWFYHEDVVSGQVDLYMTTVKIGLKQEEEEEGVVTEVLLDSGATGLVMSEEFVRRHKFKRTKLERPVYVRNVDGTLNYVGLIVNMVEVEIFFKGHKERTSIDVIGGQRWSVILGMPWLRHHNPEID